MKDDFNPGPFPANASGRPDDGLATAFEELVDGRLPSGGEPEPAMEAEACPEPEAWFALLRGEAKDAEALLRHAARCPACAEGLRSERTEPSAEEAEELKGLASMTPEGQRELAAELARTPRQTANQEQAANKPRLLQMRRPYLWAGAALAASLTVVAGGTMWWRAANTPERLMAEAYTRERIFELRMPGAGFAEVTPQVHLRGGATGRESAPLLDARARIERKLEAAPEDPHWLELEARADVLEEKFDPAIDILDRLQAAGPVTPTLLVDDAAAYFQRGAATGSENDRSTALEYLRHADELAPGDPVVLFNEAVAMEDRGQVMNAVETWNRYLRFERDPKWQAEGRRRLLDLEQKLNKVKTHASRMEQHLATPQAMRTLAADAATLGSIDEELAYGLLPDVVDSAFPMTVDRSRGSPCEDACQAARTLLYALAASLERNHQDTWLTQLFPPAAIPPDQKFKEAVRALAGAIRGDQHGDFLAAQRQAREAERQFQALHNASGEDRAQAELSYALGRSSDAPGCHREALAVAERNPQFAWIHIMALTGEHQCDPSPGESPEHDPAYQRIARLAEDHRYMIHAMRVRNLMAATAVDAGDAEEAMRSYRPILSDFYAGDFPAIRLYSALSGVAEAETFTPRVRNALLFQREAVWAVELSPLKNVVPTERFKLATAAIRADSIAEAQEQMRMAQEELVATGGEKSVKGFLAENEFAMARFYLNRHDLTAAEKVLDQARDHIAGERNMLHEKYYAEARGELELAEGHGETAEPLLRAVLLVREMVAGTGGAENISRAQKDREAYAILAGLWAAKGRSGEDVLALWERYRMRILGNSVPKCADMSFTCLKPALESAMARLGEEPVLGQVVLFDRLLLYRVTAQGVAWTQIPIRQDDVLGTVGPLERAVSSPTTPMYAVDAAARQAGKMFLADVDGKDSSAGRELLLEPDPLLGNLPWPAVETAAGPIGLRFDLEELPSLLLERGPAKGRAGSGRARGKQLIVGASIAGEGDPPLPEVVEEARAVARFSDEPSLLLGEQANQAQVTARLETASAIHFAGHAAQEEGAMRLLLAPAKGGKPEEKSAGANEAGKPWLDSSLLRKYPPREARLVVFSACATGRKEAGWNHGMGDIVATLAGIGVPDVVATRWQIDSESAVPMMDGFYGGLARGMTVSQSLTAARNRLTRDARYRHPYYWAAWYASGEGGGGGLREVFRAGQ